MMEVEGGIQCSMCGDVGIADLLFICSKCSLRPQHIYCCRSYPYLYGEASICNWCLHEQDSLTSSAENASMVLDDHTSSHAKMGIADHTNVRVNEIATHPIAELNNPAPVHVIEEYTDETLVIKTKGHGKAFEYLLLIAAQCLPQVVTETSGEIKQTNKTTSMISPKMMGSSDIRANFDPESKMGSTESNKIMGTLENQGRISNETKIPMTGLDSKQSIMELHSVVNIKMEEKMDHVGGYAGGNLPKRQRCVKGINAPPLKCRKRGLQLSPGRPNYRRYKLLADVVC